MEISSNLESLYNKRSVNEAKNTENDSAIAKNTEETTNVDANINEVKNLKTGVNSELSALQNNLKNTSDESERVIINDKIDDLNKSLKEIDEKELEFDAKKKDLEVKEKELASNKERLAVEHTEIEYQITELENDLEVLKSEESEKKENEELPTTDVPVQNNKGWQYYAELELKAEHGGDANYKPTASEINEKANEIKNRNIENGNVNKKGDLVVGTPKNPKYVTLNGEIDTSGLQTTGDALKKYGQGQAILTKEQAEAKAQAQAKLDEQKQAQAKLDEQKQAQEEARRMNEQRTFNQNLGNKLRANASKQGKITESEKNDSLTQFYANTAKNTPKGKNAGQAVKNGDISYSEAAYGNAAGQVASNFAGSGGMAAGSADMWQALYLVGKKAVKKLIN